MSDHRIIPKDERDELRPYARVTGLSVPESRALLDHADAMAERDAERVALIRDLAAFVAWCGEEHDHREARRLLARVPDELRP